MALLGPAYRHLESMIAPSLGRQVALVLSLISHNTILPKFFILLVSLACVCMVPCKIMILSRKFGIRHEHHRYCPWVARIQNISYVGCLVNCALGPLWLNKPAQPDDEIRRWCLAQEAEQTQATPNLPKSFSGVVTTYGADSSAGSCRGATERNRIGRPSLMKQSSFKTLLRPSKF